MMDSFRAYKTTKAHRRGVGWCLHIIDANANKPVQEFWFRYLMTMLSFILTYPEGKAPDGSVL